MFSLSTRVLPTQFSASLTAVNIQQRKVKFVVCALRINFKLEARRSDLVGGRGRDVLLYARPRRTQYECTSLLLRSPRCHYPAYNEPCVYCIHIKISTEKICLVLLYFNDIKSRLSVALIFRTVTFSRGYGDKI